MARKTWSNELLSALESHRWPGNFRELSHSVERAMLLTESDELTAADFVFRTARAQSDADTMNLESNERHLVEKALAQTAGNISHAADTLGITRAALYRRIEKFGL